MARYRYIVLPDQKKVICVSTYAKKPVRGVATCSADNQFDAEFGKQLAKLRCDVKVAKKRLQRSVNQLGDINKIIEFYEAERDRISQYMLDSYNAYNVAENDLAKFMSSI